MQQIWEQKFKSLQDFIGINELSEEEKTWIGTTLESFLIELEKMSMDKLYKIPVISCFLGENKLRHKVSVDEIAQKTKDFYLNPLYSPDMAEPSHLMYWNPSMINTSVPASLDALYSKFNTESLPITKNCYEKVYHLNSLILGTSGTTILYLH